MVPESHKTDWCPIRIEEGGREHIPPQLIYPPAYV